MTRRGESPFEVSRFRINMVLDLLLPNGFKANWKILLCRAPAGQLKRNALYQCTGRQIVAIEYGVAA
jgi:hypothetical protein